MEHKGVAGTVFRVCNVVSTVFTRHCSPSSETLLQFVAAEVSFFVAAKIHFLEESL
jgi:hypothetical protein